jgi:hypothetical protein
MFPDVQNTQPWENFIKSADITEHANHSTLGRNRWVVVEFFGSTRRTDVFNMLRGLQCDLVAVGTVEGERMSALCRRSVTRIFSLPCVTTGSTWTLTLTGGRNSSVRVIDLVVAWSQMCSAFVSNFDLKRIGDITTPENIVKEWQGSSKGDIAMDCLLAKGQASKKRSHRETLIVAAKPELLQVARGEAPESISSIRFDAGDDHVDLNVLVPPPSGIMLRSYDILTGVLVEVSLKDWIMKGLWSQRSLVLHGHAQCAKTPVARAICSLLAVRLQKKGGADPYYLKVGTVDSLRVAKDLMAANVPILFDEVTPSFPRGSLPPMTIECLKHITEAADTSCVHARYGDIVFHFPQPKIFTSNAASPHAWFNQLPPDIFGMEPAQRLGLCPDVQAVMKRVFFLHVEQCMIPANVRAAHDASKLAGLAAMMEDYDGPEMA